jgi:hypothetical protein
MIAFGGRGGGIEFRFLACLFSSPDSENPISLLSNGYRRFRSVRVLAWPLTFAKRQGLQLGGAYLHALYTP